MGVKKLDFICYKLEKIFKKYMLGFMVVTVFLAVLSFFPALSSEEGSTIYYVPDDYATIQEAIDVAQAGDSVIVESGVYTENIHIDKVLTVKGEGSVQIDANGLYYCFELRSDGIIIDNFKISNTGSGGNKAGIRIMSDNNIIQNCQIENNDNYGILIYKNASGNLITDTESTKNYYGIYLESATSNTVDNCHVYDNDIYGIHLRYANNNIIQKSIISDEIVGLYLWESYSNTVNENNIFSCNLHGIDLRKSDDNLIFDNIFNNSKNAYDECTNSWNVEALNGMNIVGGPYICGNYWADYTGEDSDVDGIGDESYGILGGNNEDLFPIYFHSNYAPFPPNNPNPVNEASNIKLKTSLSWDCSDPDDDECWYELYLGSSTQSLQKIASLADSTYSITDLTYDQTYYWKVIAFDNTKDNHSTPSAIWHFSTIKKPSSSSDSSNRKIPPQNIPPHADLSAGEPYQGFVNQLLLFDATLSYDSDGIITEYQWDFGDNTKENGEIIQHTYDHEGEFLITLTVVDNNGLSDTATSIAVIVEANRPPQQPAISGSMVGSVNTNYSYQLTAIDEDNDAIKYIIDWGDNQTTESAFFPNATTFETSHSWSKAGIYTVTAKTNDNKTDSILKSLTIRINAIYVLENGYLLDNTDDGIYDSYLSNQTGNITSVEKKNDDTYLIDEDGDGKWDYEFVISTQQFSIYDSSLVTEERDTAMMPLIIVLVGTIIVIILVGILYKNKKNK